MHPTCSPITPESPTLILGIAIRCLLRIQHYLLRILRNDLFKGKQHFNPTWMGSATLLVLPATVPAHDGYREILSRGALYKLRSCATGIPSKFPAPDGGDGPSEIWGHKAAPRTQSLCFSTN